MAKLWIYILPKNSSKRNVIKENYHSNKFLNYFLVGFTKFLNGILSSIGKVISSTWDSIFYYLRKPNISVERKNQLKNFDMISKLVILDVYFSRSRHTT